jgi:hypothetical protein
MKMIDIFKDFNDFRNIKKHIDNYYNLIIINDKKYIENIYHNNYYEYFYENEQLLNINDIIDKTDNKFIINNLKNLNINDECNICFNNTIQSCSSCYHFFCNKCILSLCKNPIKHDELIYITGALIDFVINLVLENNNKKNLIISNNDRVIDIFKKKLNNTLIIKPYQSLNLSLYDNVFIIGDDILYTKIFSNLWFIMNSDIYVFKKN